MNALKAQLLVSGDATLARALLKQGAMREYRPQETLTTQGAPDNDLFLIVNGRVSIRINEREVATRDAGTHVGEMALVDPLAKRSATVVAIESTVTVRVAEHQFARLANKYPELWRRVASEIASRLRERNKYVRAPNDRPVLFIGSSSEGLVVAQEIHSILRPRRLVPRIWTDGVFQASRTSIENLVAFAQDADFAALVLTPDDVTISKRSKKASPRDNLIFELGLFMGAIGRERVFILKPRGHDIKIPSDLFGITWMEYASRGPNPLRTRLRQASRQLLAIILSKGPR